MTRNFPRGSPLHPPMHALPRCLQGNTCFVMCYTLISECRRTHETNGCPLPLRTEGNRKTSTREYLPYQANDSKKGARSSMYQKEGTCLYDLHAEPRNSWNLSMPFSLYACALASGVWHFHKNPPPRVIPQEVCRQDNISPPVPLYDTPYNRQLWCGMGVAITTNKHRLQYVF